MCLILAPPGSESTRKGSDVSVCSIVLIRVCNGGGEADGKCDEVGWIVQPTTTTVIEDHVFGCIWKGRKKKKPHVEVYSGSSELKTEAGYGIPLKV
ncbi:unnamed protein product [Lactuca virosa]|uniref:Uncharacterized protein n=1 Tax=Lactuca virosa TaxID=75947 RepID=A0AAU9MGT6_9ASTR|nr:unnamed protein product [Lactuca virosa]